MMMLLKTDLSEEEVLRRINLQEPKKIIRFGTGNPFEFPIECCPNCGNFAESECGDPYMDYSLNWCDHCGQKLDDNFEDVMVPDEVTMSLIYDGTPEFRLETYKQYKNEKENANERSEACTY